MVVRKGVAEGEHTLRRLAGAQEGRQRLARIAGLVPVVGELGRQCGIDVEAGMNHVHGCGHCRMQRQSFAGQKLVIDRFLQEAVAELHDLVVARLQQMTVDRLPQRRGDLSLLHSRHDPEDVVSRGLTGYGDHAQEVSRRRGETTDPGEEHLSKREADALVAPFSDGEELLGEERIAPSALVEASDKGASGGLAQDARQLSVNFAWREPGQLESLDLSAAIQLGEQGQEWMALVHLVSAVRPDHHHTAMGEVSHQELEQIAGRSIRPMKVLQRNDGACVRGDALDQPEHLEVQAGLGCRCGRLGPSFAFVVGHQVGDQLQDGRSRRPDDAAEVVRRQ